MELAKKPEHFLSINREGQPCVSKECNKNVFRLKIVKGKRKSSDCLNLICVTQQGHWRHSLLQVLYSETKITVKSFMCNIFDNGILNPLSVGVFAVFGLWLLQVSSLGSRNKREKQIFMYKIVYHGIGELIILPSKQTTQFQRCYRVKTSSCAYLLGYCERNQRNSNCFNCIQSPCCPHLQSIFHIIS